VEAGLDMSLVLCMGVFGCLAGDFVWFEAGRHWGSQIIRILCAFSSDPHYCAQRAHRVFGRWGLRSLIVAKFIPGLDGVSARVAVGLRKRGISNVRVLKGALTAWKREGLPVTLQLSTSEEVAERFGIEIIGGEPHVTV
jgi:hypothetical protein